MEVGEWVYKKPWDHVIVCVTVRERTVLSVATYSYLVVVGCSFCSP